ncbi:sensor domain-containing diguanylate cyclase [Nakamurella flava]|uniref:GGDEF domain-containing protein n=1 Tax=Nakamurella flava TaxID=2576308 RepID=UPI00140DF80B|nr:GGDEF domain-containing protein [Nakamurella flava]
MTGADPDWTAGTPVLADGVAAPFTPWRGLPLAARRGVVAAVLAALAGVLTVGVATRWAGGDPRSLTAPGLWLLCWLAVIVDAVPRTRPLRNTKALGAFVPSLAIAIAAVLAFGSAGVLVFAVTGVTGPLLLRREPWRVLLATALSVTHGLVIVVALAAVTRGVDWTAAVTGWLVLPLTLVAATASLAVGWAVDRWLRRLFGPTGLTAVERRLRPRRTSWYLPLTAPIPAALVVVEPALLPLLGLAIVAAQLGVARVASQTALAGLDPLTGIANRSALAAALHRRLARRAGGADTAADPVTLLLADLDGFKQINDIHGHLVGDQVLAVVGQRIQAAVRAADLPARMGGDEFAVLLERGGRRGDLSGICGRIRAAVGEPLTVGRSTFRPQLTFGWAQADRVESATELIARADLELYRRKAERKSPRPSRPTPPAAGPPTASATPGAASSRSHPRTWASPTWSGPVAGVGARRAGSER